MTQLVRTSIWTNGFRELRWNRVNMVDESLMMFHDNVVHVGEALGVIVEVIDGHMPAYIGDGQHAVTRWYRIMVAELGSVLWMHERCVEFV